MAFTLEELQREQAKRARLSQPSAPQQERPRTLGERLQAFEQNVIQPTFRGANRFLPGGIIGEEIASGIGSATGQRFTGAVTGERLGKGVGVRVGRLAADIASAGLLFGGGALLRGVGGAIGKTALSPGGKGLAKLGATSIFGATEGALEGIRTDEGGGLGAALGGALPFVPAAGRLAGIPSATRGALRGIGRGLARLGGAKGATKTLKGAALIGKRQDEVARLVRETQKDVIDPLSTEGINRAESTFLENIDEFTRGLSTAESRDVSQQARILIGNADRLADVAQKKRSAILKGSDVGVNVKDLNKEAQTLLTKLKETAGFSREELKATRKVLSEALNDLRKKSPQGFTTLQDTDALKTVLDARIERDVAGKVAGAENKGIQRAANFFRDFVNENVGEADGKTFKALGQEVASLLDLKTKVFPKLLKPGAKQVGFVSRFFSSISGRSAVPLVGGVAGSAVGGIGGAALGITLSTAAQEIILRGLAKASSPRARIELIQSLQKKIAKIPKAQRGGVAQIIEEGIEDANTPEEIERLIERAVNAVGRSFAEGS